MKCLNCQEEVPEHVRSCMVCGRDVGYPNVRAAVRTEEVKALELRINEAEENADSLGCKSILENFRDAVAQSEAVVCCPLGKLSELVSSDNQLYQTFYQAVGSEGRLPEDNEWQNVGNQQINELMLNNNIKFGIFGHIHEAGRKAVDDNDKIIQQGVWSNSLNLNAGPIMEWDMNNGEHSEGSAGIIDIDVENDRARYWIVDVD